MTNLEQTVPTQDITQAKISIKNGYQFFFNDDGREICAQGSPFSGKEVIIVGGNIVSKKRNYWTKSVHRFAVEPDHYEIEFNMVNILKGTLDCTLVKNDVHVKTLTLCQIADIAFSLKAFAIFFAGGLAFGALAALFFGAL